MLSATLLHINVVLRYILCHYSISHWIVILSCSVFNRLVNPQLIIPVNSLTHSWGYLLNLVNVNLAVRQNQISVKVIQFRICYIFVLTSFVGILLQISIFVSTFSGHFGYIQLPVPIYHPAHVNELKQMLSLLCLKCLKIKKAKVLPH